MGRHGQWPIDADGGIVPAHAGIGSSVIRGGALISEHGTLGHHRKSVSKAFGNPEVSFVFGREHHRRPTPERGRATTDIHRHVVHLALQHADQLSLRIRPLVMQPAQHASRGSGDIALDELHVQAGLGKTRLVPAFVEKPACVTEHPWFNHHATGQIGFDQLHASSPRNSASKYWP